MINEFYELSQTATNSVGKEEKFSASLRTTCGEIYNLDITHGNTTSGTCLTKDEVTILLKLFKTAKNQANKQ